MNRPVHFEYQTPDPEATCRFFTKVFGWTFETWEGPQEYHLATTGDGDGINGGVMRAPDGQSRTVNTLQVESVDEAAKKVEAAGGQVVVPKMAIQGVGWVSYCLDPAGVLFGIYTHDPQAK